jgi:hypothetical protein
MADDWKVTGQADSNPIRSLFQRVLCHAPTGFHASVSVCLDSVTGGQSSAKLELNQGQHVLSSGFLQHLERVIHLCRFL